MTEQQQPECPAEFAWMKPGVFADYREYQIIQIMELPAIEQNEWRVRCQYTTETYGHLPCADLEMYGSDSEFNHVCARLEEAEARVAMMTVVDGELSIALDRASRAEARVKELEFENERLKDSVEMLRRNVKSETVAKHNEQNDHGMTKGSLMIAQVDILQLTERASKAEARASASDAKLARVKSLLDGVAPVLNELSLMQSFVNELDEDDDYYDWISAKEHRDGAAGEHLPALLSLIQQIGEVLKGE